MKLAGIIIIIITSVLIGYNQFNKYKKRISELEAILIMTQKIKNFISFQKTKSKDIILNLNSSNQLLVLPFLKEFEELNTFEKDFKHLWTTSINQTKDKTNLKKEDTDLLFSIADIIGNTDKEGQLGGLKLVESLFEQNLISAREEYKRKAKAKLSLWILSGLAVAILFL